MERATVNRNLIRAGRAPFNALVAQGYSPAEIRMAWEQRQKAARAEARKPRFFPQLKRWLESAAADGARAMIEALRAEGGGAVIPVGAPKTLPALASADERFGRAYWAFLDARSRVAEAGGDPASDADCKRLHRVMQSERKAAYERFAAKQE